MFRFGSQAIFILIVTMVTAVKRDILQDYKFKCTADRDEEKDPTSIYIGCDTEIIETSDTVCIPVFRTNSRGLLRIKYAIKRLRETGNYAVYERHGILFFSPGENEICVTAYVSDDSFREDDEEYLFQITEASRGTIARANATLTVMDNDK